ncbi:putative oxidoreductase CipA [Xylogone sp. PMI_703]|nr:putative oxidoreductase CipA [Xylogone sp. PMI_703]
MAKNYIENVAIVGASGNVGKHIVEHLLKTGKHKVTAITREDSTNEIPDGVIVKKVNYSNQQSLVDALQGQDALIITMSVFAPPETQTKLIDAAAAADVPWVLPNEFGSDPFNAEINRDSILGNVKAKYREHIEELGKSSWIALVCSFWYEFSLAGGPYRYGFDFKNKTLTLFDNGDVKINTSTWPQCGRAIASLLSLKVAPDNENDKSPSLADFKNKPVYISSFTISQKDMFDSVLRVTGDEAKDWKVTSVPVKEYYQEGVEEFKAGDRTGFAKLLYSRAFFPESSGNYGAIRGLHNDILGLPKDDIDEYTKVALKIVESGAVY